MHPKKLNITFIDESTNLQVVAKQNLLIEVLEGNWSSIYKGRGMEFSEYRNYVYGDDASTIDWKASMRSSNTLVKVYEQDKDAKAVFVFDVSDSMLFSSRKDGKMKAEYSAELIASMVKAVARTGDAVGLIMFNDHFVARVNPNIGSSIEYKIKTELLDPKNYGGKFDFIQAMKQLMNIIGNKVVVIIVSDFIGLQEGWYKYIQILGQKFEIIGIMIKDHRDRYLPDIGGQIVLQDPSNDNKIFVDSHQYSKIYHKKVLEEEANIEKWFKASRSELLRIDTREDGLLKLVKFFSKRVVLKSVKK